MGVGQGAPRETKERQGLRTCQAYVPVIKKANHCLFPEIGWLVLGEMATKRGRGKGALKLHCSVSVSARCYVPTSAALVVPTHQPTKPHAHTHHNAPCTV